MTGKQEDPTIPVGALVKVRTQISGRNPLKRAREREIICYVIGVDDSSGSPLYKLGEIRSFEHWVSADRVEVLDSDPYIQ